MFIQLALLCIFFIIRLIFLLSLHVSTCKITLTVWDSIYLLPKCFFILFRCWSHPVSISDIFVLLHNRCLCVLN
jgi:hypothetical protein